jgi:hypothetical protein
VCTAVSRDTCSTTVSLPESLNASLINRSVETVPTVEPVETETVETVETETHSVAKDLFSDGGRGGGGEAVGGQSSEGGGAVSSTKNTLRSRKESCNNAATSSATMLQQPQSCNNQALGRVSRSEGGGAESTQTTLRSRKENCLHALTDLNTEMKDVVDAQQRQMESVLAYAAAREPTKKYSIKVENWLAGACVTPSELRETPKSLLHRTVSGLSLQRGGR